jgi:hypothetical protein
MEVSELLEHDLGHGQVDDLDTAPPLALLAMLPSGAASSWTGCAA